MLLSCAKDLHGKKKPAKEDQQHLSGIQLSLGKGCSRDWRRMTSVPPRHDEETIRGLSCQTLRRRSSHYAWLLIVTCHTTPMQFVSPPRLRLQCIAARWALCQRAEHCRPPKVAKKFSWDQLHMSSQAATS